MYETWLHRLPRRGMTNDNDLLAGSSQHGLTGHRCPLVVVLEMSKSVNDLYSAYTARLT